MRVIYIAIFTTALCSAGISGQDEQFDQLFVNDPSKSLPLPVYKKTVKTHQPSLLQKFLEAYASPINSGSLTEHNKKLFIDTTEERRDQPKNGWVSLEAVPVYSSGKVYKWKSVNSYKSPLKPSWENNKNPSEDFDDSQGYLLPSRPFGSTYPENEKYKPFINRNSNTANNHFAITKPPHHFGLEEYYSSDKPWSDLIIDNRSPNFPDTNTDFKRKKDSNHPSTYPDNGDGQWVLISRTGGQSNNYRSNSGRNLNLAASVTTLLNVVPNNNSVNITTQNGEVIEISKNSRKAKELRNSQSKIVS